MTAHIFLETNWVVAYAAPVYFQQSSANELLERARERGDRLHVPAICLTEARHTIQRKHQPRREADTIRRFLAWARDMNHLDDAERDELLGTVSQLESSVQEELDDLDVRLDSLRRDPAIEVFALDESMLARALDISSSELRLEPFDQAILAAVVVRAEQLRARGERGICFCERDSDLQCWNRKGHPKPLLQRIYDQAGVWVYGDFEMNTPSPPSGWGDPAD